MLTMHCRSPVPRSERGVVGFLAALGIVVLVTIGATLWWANRYIYATEFTPTKLSAAEQQELDRKLSKLDAAGTTPLGRRPARDGNGPLEPEPYSENDADREINLTERELNSLVAKNEEAAERVAIDLADDLVSLKLLVPFDDDFPFIGGTTLRLAAGLELGYADGHPIVAVRGLSLGGIPLPKAWWGDIKNKNLVEEFGGPGGFWDQFSKGVEGIRVREGRLWIKLRE